MIPVPQTPIQRGDLEIPGGWVAHVPEIIVSAEDIPRYFALVRSLGVPGAKLSSEIQETVQEVLNQGWCFRLRKKTGYWAEEYAARYGDLQGFRPEQAQLLFWPGKNTGRAGERGREQLFADMRRGE